MSPSNRGTCKHSLMVNRKFFSACSDAGAIFAALALFAFVGEVAHIVLVLIARWVVVPVVGSVRLTSYDLQMSFVAALVVALLAYSAWSAENAMGRHREQVASYRGWGLAHLCRVMSISGLLCLAP